MRTRQRRVPAYGMSTLVPLGLHELGDLRSRLHERWRRSPARDQALSGEIERVALLMLVKDMRAQHGPGVARVVLCESDQGPVLQVEALLAADGSRLVGDEAHDTYVAAWDLTHGSDVVASFSALCSRSRFGGPAWHVDAERVLSGLPFPEGGLTVSDDFVPLA